MKSRLKVIFEEKPKQWGLRGDPYLWDDLLENFLIYPVSIDELEFIEVFNSAFIKLTGGSIDKVDYIYVPNYDHGGMSSGMISPEFWKEVALPMLLDRLRDLKSK